MAKPDKHSVLRARARDVFEGARRSRGRRLVTQGLHPSGNPIVVSEKVVRRIMLEEGLTVICMKRRGRYSSYKGEPQASRRTR